MRKMREGVFLPGSRWAVWMMGLIRVKLQPGHPVCSTMALPPAVCTAVCPYHTDPHTMALISSSPAVMPAPGLWWPGHPWQGPQVWTAPSKSCAVTYTHHETGGMMLAAPPCQALAHPCRQVSGNLCGKLMRSGWKLRRSGWKVILAFQPQKIKPDCLTNIATSSALLL